MVVRAPRRLQVAFAVSLALAVAPSVLAQETGAPAGPCLLDPVRDGCDSWWVFEIAGYVPLAVSAETFSLEGAPRQEARAFGPHVRWDAGWMRRLGGRDAIGVTGMVGYGGPAERYGLEGRWRRELAPGWSLDASAGWLHAVVDDFGQLDGDGVSAEARLSRGDWLSAGLRYDRVTTEAIAGRPFHLFPTAQALHGGVALRQRAGLWGTAGAGAALGGYILLYWLLGPDE